MIIERYIKYMMNDGFLLLKRQVRPVVGPAYTQGLNGIYTVFFLFFPWYVHLDCHRTRIYTS